MSFYPTFQVIQPILEKFHHLSFSIKINWILGQYLVNIAWIVYWGVTFRSVGNITTADLSSIIKNPATFTRTK